ncbi:MAG: endonuclease MutS2 [Christensenellaceae bacterium]|jgi:DNA mismatch repair protein MutS2|nr:endonuclease MutS2 [Christensenellaceae bacterium]
MQDRVLKTLEYDKIRAMLAERAGCCVGRELAEAIEPCAQADGVRRQLACTAEAEGIYLRTGHAPVDDFPDMRVCLKRMHAALYLTPGELLGVSRCLRAARLCKEAVEAQENCDLLQNMAAYLPTHRSIEEEIARCIIGEEEIFDGASPALSRIRRSMRLTNEKVRERLDAMIRSTSFQKYLQEPLITIRSGRFVLPIKQEYRQNVPGLVHDQSGSGATLFIEPAAVVELGNEYKKLLGEEAEEIERILAELTALCAPYGEDIYHALAVLGDIDLAFAKAKLAKDMRAVRPKLNDEGYVRILRGRHPLIPANRVQPIDIWLGRDFTTLIITGPNTGGKTVTLKTVGLFVLMAHSGMFIPADEGSELSVFDAVYADIGDEQSIEQSLSTFSGHMTNIVEILAAATPGALVLLDELGAGTDPIEGAALAMSILEELHARGVRTVATTHYSEIKAFALTKAGMENASMEFDVDRLCPTYRLFIGIPGKSNAFEISSRLGLQPHLIEAAKGYLKNEDIRFEDIISGAQAQRRLAEEEKDMAARARQELERLRREVDAEREKLGAEQDRLRAKAREEARKIVSAARDETEKLIKELRGSKGISQSSADREIQRARDALRAQEAGLAELAAPKKHAAGSPPKTVSPGDTVRIVSLEQKASVLTKPDAKGDVLVQAGIVKLTVPLADLRLAQDNTPQKGLGKIQLETNEQAGLQLDVRGLLVDEAVLAVDRYLDNAAMHGLSEVSILHGKGTGALRSGIQDYLRHHKRVRTFRIGNYGEGDAGVTVVTLKK